MLIVNIESTLFCIGHLSKPGAYILAAPHSGRIKSLYQEHVTSFLQIKEVQEQDQEDWLFMQHGDEL